MQWLAPWALVALAPLAGAIILLYLLRLKRQQVTVSSVFLWRRVIEDVEANTPFQRLRKNLLLLLQLLALALLVLALAGPYVLSAHPSGGSSVLVLDASASMKATDEPGSRFAAAQRRARQLIENLGRGEEAALVVSASRASVACPFTSDRRLLESAVSAAQATDESGDMRQALLLALSLAQKRPQPRLYVLSDGAFPPLTGLPGGATLQFLRVGTRCYNVALLALEVSRRPGQGDEVFLRVKNFAAQSKTGSLSFYLEDQLLDAQPLTLAAGEDRSLTYKLTLPRPGLLSAHLDMPDDLAADNVAYTFGAGGQAASVLLVTPGNLFLEQVLGVLPDLQVFKTASLSAEQVPAAFRTYDAVIFDRVPVPPLPPAGAVMLIATDATGAAASLGASLATPGVTEWETAHPVLRSVNLAAAKIGAGKALLPAAGARVLARAGEDPVLVALDQPGRRQLIFGWNFLDSDLPLRVGFPVLIGNSLRWLLENGTHNHALTIRPGQPVRFAVPAGITEAVVTGPGGRRERLAVRDGQVVYTGSDTVGEYRLVAGPEQWRWAADLRDAAESNLTPSDRLQLGEQRVAEAAPQPRAPAHLWPYLALLALAVLLGEWHLYHRR
jgi:hypothetical protein